MSLNTDPVGFIGLGIMGKGMAGRLISQNIVGTPTRPLYIWNRSTEKCEEFKKSFPDANIVVQTSAKDVVAR